jgi:hypothetical protein
MIKRTVFSVAFFGASLFVAGVVSGQEANPTGQTVRISWNAPTTQEDGTPVSPDDIRVDVFRDQGVGVCSETVNSNCVTELAWDECATFYGTATQLSTGLTSKPSASVDVCAAPEPDWDVAPAPPVINVIIE